ncbi:hypothetical protein KFE25_012373 [Diacronema lutheri]|uniref:Uncharacterized protein n=1 Tax=Diacronema lutheri TaxID=2081491 RepID=A0A8J5XT89_DIALT|nr:hypothetical protein KFE25_012373 [Diacronema lutheri]
MRAPRRLWTKEEDASLVDAVELHGSRSWDKIADLLPGRTASQCNARFLHYLHPNVSHKPFSPAEDMCILSSYMLIGAQWATIALDLPGRTNHAIKNRWQSLRTRVLKEAHVGATPSAAGCQPSREHAPPFERGRGPTPLLPSSSADELCLTGAAMSADDASDDTDGSKTTDNAGAQAYRHRRDSDASSPSVGATSSAGELDESLLAFDFFDADLDLFDALFADLNGTGRG